jgi:hypothetical protein
MVVGAGRRAPGGGVKGKTVDGVEEARREEEHVVLHAIDEAVDQVRGIYKQAQQAPNKQKTKRSIA